MEENNREINLQDTKVKAEGDKIVTDLYQKPTDSQQYVHFKSCHPSHTKGNLSFNLAGRICTIVENENMKIID